MLKIYNNLPDIEFNTIPQRSTFSRALFGLVWFHAILI